MAAGLGRRFQAGEGPSRPGGMVPNGCCTAVVDWGCRAGWSGKRISTTSAAATTLHIEPRMLSSLASPWLLTGAHNLLQPQVRVYSLASRLQHPGDESYLRPLRCHRMPSKLSCLAWNPDAPGTVTGELCLHGGAGHVWARAGWAALLWMCTRTAPVTHRHRNQPEILNGQI